MFSLGSVQLIAQNYIKYNRLAELTNFAFAGSNASECDILIRRININFFDVIENEFNQEKSTHLINDFIKMFNHKYSDFKSKYFELDLINNISLSNAKYEEFKSLLDQNLLLKFVYVLSLKQNFLEAALILQYMKNIDYDLVYKLLKNSSETTTINFNKFAFIWKSVYVEYLSNFFYMKRNEDALKKIKPIYSLVLRYYYIENMTIEEIAEKLECSVRYVYNLKSRALGEVAHFIS